VERRGRGPIPPVSSFRLLPPAQHFSASDRSTRQQQHVSVSHPHRTLLHTHAPLGSRYAKEVESTHGFFKGEGGVKPPTLHNAKWWYQLPYTQLNYYQAIHRPKGVIEGGPENYDGMGLKLHGNLDRQREFFPPQQHTHGVKGRHHSGWEDMIDPHPEPDGCSRCQFGETEEDWDRRAWGEWDYPYGFKHNVESAKLLKKDTSFFPQAWVDIAFHNVQRFPAHVSGQPASRPPFMEWNWIWAGQKMLEKSADARIANRLERQQKRDYFRAWLKDMTDDIEGRGPKTIDEENELIKKRLGLRRMSDDDLRRERDNNRYGKEWMLHMNLDFVSNETKIDTTSEGCWHGGNWNYTMTEEELNTKDKWEDSHGKHWRHMYDDRFNERVITRPVNCMNDKMTAEEMEEMYHYTCTEQCNEGRGQYPHYTIETIHEYKERPLRKKFKRLMCLYTPLWSFQDWGETFGHALEHHEKLPAEVLDTFGAEIPVKTTENTKVPQEQFHYLREYERYYEDDPGGTSLQAGQKRLVTV